MAGSFDFGGSPSSPSRGGGGYVPPQPEIPIRYPLGLPQGSVRALLTFMILGTVWTLLLMPAEKFPEGKVGIPLYLYYLTFLVIGSYFGARAAKPKIPGSREASPLFLPRGSIRFLTIVGFIGVIGYGYYKDPSFFDRLREVDITQQPFLPLVIFGGFFLGLVISSIAHAILATPEGMPGWYQDIQASLSLLAMIALGGQVIFELVIKPSMSQDKPIDLPQAQLILSGIVAFYFGARS